MTDCIAILNAGSSSVKFAIYRAAHDGSRLASGQIEKIGIAPHLTIVDAGGRQVEDRQLDENVADPATAAKEILSMARVAAPDANFVAVGHRIVHGGEDFGAPKRLTVADVESLERLIPLAPLHQPANLAPIRAIFDASPDLPQIGCFDTAFHRTQSNLARAFALPKRFSEMGVRRYGFHGLSYEYIASRFRELDPSLAAKRLVIAHLGNGASLCAVREGISVANTMGFTAVDGLMMGTRSGSLDPGVLVYMMREQGMDAGAIEDLIYRQSGLLGVSGISSDMRTLRASREPAAREAIDLFVYRIARELGSLVAALGGLDAIVFSGGIGEHDSATRAEVVASAAWTGARLDESRNNLREGLISSADSKVAVWVVPTDEERLIATQCMRLLHER